jgi:hypothetical protein
MRRTQPTVKKDDGEGGSENENERLRDDQSQAGDTGHPLRETSARLRALAAGGITNQDICRERD